MRPIAQRRPIGVRLTDILAPEFPPPAEVFATSCTDHADRVRPGDVFVAHADDALSAASLANQAVARGVAAVVSNQLLPLTRPTPQFVVNDTHTAFGELCHALSRRPCDDLATIAVAGASGRGSVARLLHSIFGKRRNRTAVASGDRWFDGAASTETIGKRVSPAAVAAWLARSVANGCGRAVAEFSAGATTDRRYCGARFDEVCITELESLTPRGNQSVSDARRLATGALAFANADCVLIANADDPACCRRVADWRGPVVTFGQSPTADVTAQVAERHAGGQVFVLKVGAESVAVNTTTIGDAHLRNCLAAAATALASGATLAEIAAGIEAAPRAPLTMQPVVSGQGFPVYLDQASTPRAVAEAAWAVAAIAAGRTLTVLAESAPCPGAERQALIAAARSASDLVIAVGSTEPADEGVRVVGDLLAAQALALALAEEGDAVLVAGCRPGSDREEATARRLLALRLANEPDAQAAGQAA